jgi:hypothetical protein
MLRTDLDELAAPYIDIEDPPDKSLRRRLNVDCPRTDDLVAAVLGDLDPKVFGVGWWAPHLESKRRILIADVLIQALSSIGANLIETRLHTLELADWCERESAKMADAIVIDESSGEPRVRHPRPISPIDEVVGFMSTLHVVGCLRALNSVLDCLAAGIVGVAALPIDIQRVGFGNVISFLGDRDRHASQIELLNKVEAHIAAVGPTGWLAWLQRCRNMTVHRGRRMNARHLVQRQPILLGPNGQIVLRADVVHVLPSEPEWSDIQALLGDGGPLLREPALTTLGGLLNSTLRLTEEVATHLLDLWSRRREQPDLLLQPAEQWREVQATRATRFPGYAPGTAPDQMSLMTGSPSLVVRMQAAALESANRHVWSDTE